MKRPTTWYAALPRLDRPAGNAGFSGTQYAGSLENANNQPTDYAQAWGRSSSPSGGLCHLRLALARVRMRRLSIFFRNVILSRPGRYMDSKTAPLSAFENHVSRRAGGGTVCGAFAGLGIVGSRLKGLGFACGAGMCIGLRIS